MLIRDRIRYDVHVILYIDPQSSCMFCATLNLITQYTSAYYRIAACIQVLIYTTV